MSENPEGQPRPEEELQGELAAKRAEKLLVSFIEREKKLRGESLSAKAA